MLDIEILNILTINFNTIGTKETNRSAKYIQIQPTPAGCEKHHTNTRQEASKPGWYCTKTSSNLNLKSNSTDKPMVND